MTGWLAAHQLQGPNPTVSQSIQEGLEIREGWLARAPQAQPHHVAQLTRLAGTCKAPTVTA